MNRAQLITLYDQDQRVEIRYPDTRREVTPLVVRHVATSADGAGTILYSRLNKENADAVIGEQIAYFESLGQGFEWKVYDHDWPSDLKERLAARGFIVEEAEAILVLDLDAAPDILWQPPRHDVRRIQEFEFKRH